MFLKYVHTVILWKMPKYIFLL